MRLLLLSTIEGVSWGGCEAIVSALAMSSQQRGIETAISAYPFRPRASQMETLVRTGVTLLERPFRPHGRLQELRYRLRSPLRALKQWRPGVVVINEANFLDGVARFEGELVTSWLNDIQCPYIVLIHANSTAALADESLRNRAAAYYKKALLVGVLGNGAALSLQRQLGQCLENLTVFRNPLLIPDAANEVRAGESPVRFAMVGRLDPVKAPDLAMEALADPRLRGRRWSLTCFGSGDEKYFRAVADHFGIGDRVRFAGHVQNGAAVWDEHDVLLLPSRTEGLPLSMLECMAAGRIAVATNVGVIDEWVFDGKTGFLAEAPRAGYLVNALLRLWDQLPNLRAIGVAARQLVIERSSSGLDANGIVDALPTLLRDASTRSS